MWVKGDNLGPGPLVHLPLLPLHYKRHLRHPVSGQRNMSVKLLILYVVAEHLLEPVQQLVTASLFVIFTSFPLVSATPLVNILAGVSNPPFPLASGSD